MAIVAEIVRGSRDAAAWRAVESKRICGKAEIPTTLLRNGCSDHAKFRDGLCFRELEWDTQAIYSKNDEEEATATDTVDSKDKSAVYIG